MSIRRARASKSSAIYGFSPDLGHPRTQRLRSPWPAVGKRASDLKSENIGLPVELRMPSWQTRGSIETLVLYFRSFPLFLKLIKSRLFRQARYENWIWGGRWRNSEHAHASYPGLDYRATKATTHTTDTWSPYRNHDSWFWPKVSRPLSEGTRLSRLGLKGQPASSLTSARPSVMIGIFLIGIFSEKRRICK